MTHVYDPRSPGPAVYQRTQAGASPVEIDETRRHLRLETQADDVLLEALLDHATALVEEHSGRDVRANAWDLLLSCFADEIPIRRHPVDVITQITRVVDGSPVPVASTVYALRQLPSSAAVVLLTGQEWPTDADDIPQPVTVSFTTAADERYAPHARAAILLVVAHLYENRGDLESSEDPIRASGAARLLEPMLVPRV